MYKWALLNPTKSKEKVEVNVYKIMIKIRPLRLVIHATRRRHDIKWSGLSNEIDTNLQLARKKFMAELMPRLVVDWYIFSWPVPLYPFHVWSKLTFFVCLNECCDKLVFVFVVVVVAWIKGKNQMPNLPN